MAYPTARTSRKNIGVLQRLLLTLGTSFWLACGGFEESASTEAPSVAEPLQLTLVTVAAFPNSAIAEMAVLNSWLNEQLASEGIQVGIRVARTVPEVAEWLVSGEGDFYLDSPYPVLLARSLSGCRPILRRWKFGSPTYRSVIFAHQDSAVGRLEELLGHTISFEDRYSSSSFYLPFDFLQSKGIDGVFLARAGDPVPSDRVGFVFAGEDRTTMHWVLAGKVPAGAMNEWNFGKLAGEEREKLKILATTSEIPRYLVAAREGLDPVYEGKVRDLLLSAHLNPSGQEMLKAYSSTERFDELPADFLQNMDRLQTLVTRLEDLVDASARPSPD